MTITQRRTLGAYTLSILLVVAAFPPLAGSQSAGVNPKPHPKSDVDSGQMAGMAEHAMAGPMDEIMVKHMELTPIRAPTHADSVRATKLVTDLKRAIAKYADTSAAVADGYKLFLPNVKQQHVFHFTNGRHALGETFRFDPEKPTSVLYKRGTDGALHLIGAMYTMPKGAKLSRLDDRIPLSIARWHKHVNWCVPRKGDDARWFEQKNGKPVFGPESPIATKAECDSVRGDFHPNLFGWMIHANVYDGSDLGTIFGDDHVLHSR